MKTFIEFLGEASRNQITKSSKEASVVKNDKYSSPTDFKSNAKKVGKLQDLEIHSSASGNGLTHFTWSPKDRMIHHVVHAIEANENNDRTELKFLSAHSREGSPVRMGDLYAHLVKNHKIDFIGTRHSPGAEKMWAKFHKDPDLKILGRHEDGKEKELKASDDHYGNDKSPDASEKKLAKMQLVLTKR